MKYKKYAVKLCGYMMNLHRGPGKKINNMSRGEMAMMGCLSMKMNGKTPVDICRELDISSAAVASTMNKLEAKGLIKREDDLKDRRRVTVHLTEKGKRFSAERESEMADELAELLGALDEEEVKDLVAIVKKLSESVKEG